MGTHLLFDLVATGLQPPSLTNQLKAFNFDDLTISTCEQWQKQLDCVMCSIL